jgi:hypothetical protein
MRHRSATSEGSDRVAGGGRSWWTCRQPTRTAPSRKSDFRWRTFRPKWDFGLRNRKVASALASRGFGKDDLEEGLALLRGVTDVSLAVLPPSSPNPAVIEQIDRWENEWFPVANATLLRHHPEIHARVFLNLSQTEGVAVSSPWVPSSSASPS